MPTCIHFLHCIVCAHELLWPLYSLWFTMGHSKIRDPVRSLTLWSLMAMTQWQLLWSVIVALLFQVSLQVHWIRWSTVVIIAIVNVIFRLRLFTIYCKPWKAEKGPFAKSQISAINGLQYWKYLEGGLKTLIRIVVHLKFKVQLQYFPVTALLEMHLSGPKHMHRSSTSIWRCLEYLWLPE